MRTANKRVWQQLFSFGLAISVSIASQSVSGEPSVDSVKQLVENLKQSERGPFELVRWFCEDGSIIVPRQGDCGRRGGGHQHGQLKEEVAAARAAGYWLGNLYITTPSTITADQLSWITLERYLMARDDGWIFRKARFIRGLIQAEDEQAGAQRLFLNLLSNSQFTKQHYLLLREAFRFSPLLFQEGTISFVRAESSKLAQLDGKFVRLKTKLHNLPEPSDVGAVRNYARSARGALQTRYAKLADALERTFRLDTKTGDLQSDFANIRSSCGGGTLRVPSFRSQPQGIANIDQFEDHFDTLIELRKLVESYRTPECKLAALKGSVHLEDYLIANILGAQTRTLTTTRAELIKHLYSMAKALFGMGYISLRQREALSYSTALLLEKNIDANTYQEELNYLMLLTSWAQSFLRYEFSSALETLAPIEPIALDFMDDRLRTSFLGVYGRILDTLLQDSSQLKHIQHFFFGERISVGLRPLNAGIARGRLVDPLVNKNFDPHRSILLIPETLPNLPAVAGILTKHAGNPVSHVQLLARNLGIPNIVVDNQLIPRLQRHIGEELVVASTHTGVALIDEYGARWERYFTGAEAPKPQKLIPDLDKLDLDYQQTLLLTEISDKDSGVRVGPKAATLGELRRMFPKQVAPAVALPFGIFERMLQEQRVGYKRLKFKSWLRERYREIEIFSGSPKKQKQILKEVRDAILRWEIPADLRAQLRQTLGRAFGSSATSGVFVRSDTNIEDLPNFSGAGLNKTVANVVGFEAILESIKEVWASPFTERAYSWRQAMMDDPLQVYPSVLIMQSVPADKSGVMITAHVNSGDRQWLTIATNRGIGGVVNNQEAETILLNRQTGVVRLYSHATAHHYRSLSRNGGIIQHQTAWTEKLIDDQELLQLNRLALEIHSRFPGMHKNGDRIGVADVEFGFVNGRLNLFQIRPYIEGLWVRESALLKKLTENGKTELNEKDLGQQNSLRQSSLYKKLTLNLNPELQ